jgi:hypothetical protein
LEHHYFSDVHAMLRLPAPAIGVIAGCNFATFQVLASVVSGVSVTLYKRSRGSGDSGELFKGLLVDYYPWSEEPQPPSDPARASELIYSLFRNPLAHDLGIDLKTKKRIQKPIIKRLTVGQSGHTEGGVEALEAAARPPRLSPTIKIQPDRVVLLVEAFYWGIRRMVVRLNADRKRIAEAEKFLESRGIP